MTAKCCGDFRHHPAKPNCCEECHEDMRAGEPAMQIDLPGGDTAFVCCTVGVWLEKEVERGMPVMEEAMA